MYVCIYIYIYIYIHEPVTNRRSQSRPCLRLNTVWVTLGTAADTDKSHVDLPCMGFHAVLAYALRNESHGPRACQALSDINTYVCVHIYIYIYRERERDIQL